MSVLRGITWDHPRGHAPLVAASRLYERLNGVRVVWDKRSLKDFGDADLGTLAQAYDLVVVDHPHVGEAARSGCIRQFDEVVDPDKLAVLQTQSAGPSYPSYHYNGCQWALPLDAACQVSACHPDMLEPSLVPDSWEQVYQLGTRLREQGLWIGMALCPTDALCSFLTLCAQLGNPPDESGKWIQLETTVAVLEALGKLRDICHPDSLHWNPITLFDTMASGDTVVYAPLAFGYINYVQEGFRKHRLAFSGVPERKGALLGGAGLAISNRVEDPHIAGDYCLWVCGSDCQSTTYLASGGQPGNGAAWTLPSDKPQYRNFLNPTRETMEQAYVRPRFAGWPAFQEELGNRVHAFLKADDDPVRVHRDLESLYMEAFVTDETV